MTADGQKRLLVVGGPAGLPGALRDLDADLGLVVEAVPREGELLDARLGKKSDKLILILSGNPDRDEGEEWLRQTRHLIEQAPAARVILLSSLEVYRPDHHSIGMVTEDTEGRAAVVNSRADFWGQIEAGVQELVSTDRLLVLRCAHLIGEWADGWLNQLLRHERVVTVMGYDPSIQLIHERDFARAVQAAIKKGLCGIYNLAPSDALPLRRILKAAQVRRLPLPWALLRIFGGRKEGQASGAASADRHAYFRYSCTGCGDRFARETKVRLSTTDALGQFVGEERGALLDLAEYSDPHGLDAPFIHRASESGLKFFEKIYFRVERTGMEHIPKEGSAILVGPHRGFMPLDAVMMVQMVTKYCNRPPRFLLHPSLVKMGVLAPFMRRMGGVIASKKNADEVLERGDLLGIYPEGVRGTFKYYKDVYKLGRFGRPDYARFAIEHSVPVVPFVMVGCAEIYPIFAKLEWNWTKKVLEWPCIPITPTFPHFLLPLPTKWHLQVLPPIDPASSLAEAERSGREPYQVMAEQVKNAVDQATKEILAKRKSLFFGKLFEDRG